MISAKPIRRWREIRDRHPERAEVEKPLLWVIPEFERLHRSGMTKDRIRVHLVEEITKCGLAAEFDRFRERVEEIERIERERVAAHQEDADTKKPRRSGHRKKQAAKPSPSLKAGKKLDAVTVEAIRVALAAGGESGLRHYTPGPEWSHGARD